MMVRRCQLPLMVRWLAHSRRGLPWIALGLLLGLLLALAGCGGGGSGSGGGTGAGTGGQSGNSGAAVTGQGPDATHAGLTLGLTGGGVSPAQHVWVQLTRLAWHTEATRPWRADDTSWVVVNFAAPVLVDLAATGSGAQSDVTRVATALRLPAGTYAQMRLFALDAQASLSDVARTHGLLHNAQVDDLDAQGQARHRPLVLATPDWGWRVTGPWALGAAQASYQVVQIDLSQGLLGEAAVDGVLLQAHLRSFDMARSGAIIGHLAPEQLCGGSGASATPACAQDVVVSAQQLAADGLRREAVRRARVDASGGFALYPLPVGARFDVVVTGRHMRPLVIREVPVTPFDATADFAWTVLGDDAPLTLTLDAGADTEVALGAGWSAGLAPAATRLYWGQSVSGDGVPHEWLSTPVSPWTGQWSDGMAAVRLPPQPVQVATFVTASTAAGVTRGEPLAWQATTPQEGVNTFSLHNLGWPGDTAAPAQAVWLDPHQRAVLTAVASATAPQPGALVIQMQGRSLQAGEVAELALCDAQGVREVHVVDASWLASVQRWALPVRQASADTGGSVYRLQWRVRSPQGVLRWQPATGTLDLRQADELRVTVSLP